MSNLLELLGRGLDGDLSDMLDRYFWTAGAMGIAELKQKISEHPEYPDLQCRMGMAYLRGCRFSEAIEHLSRACRDKEDFLAARLALAASFEQAGRLDDALEQLDIASGQAKDEIAILFCHAFVLEKLDRSDEAIDAYMHVLNIDDRMLAARRRLAAIALLSDNLAMAIEQYQYLVEDNPGDATLRATLAQLQYRASQYEDSVRNYEAAIALEPENWALMDEQVEALVADGQLREAIERLCELIELQGDFPDLHVRIADLYSQAGDDTHAMWHYSKAIDIQHDYLEAHVKIGTQHLINSRWDMASESFANAVELNDKLLASYVGMGVSQYAEGDVASAMASFDLAAAVDPNSTLLVREMARLQLKGQLESDPQSIDPQLIDDSTEEFAHRDLLKLQLRLHAEHVKTESGNATVHYRYGVLLRAEGRLQEALAMFDRAVELNPTFTQAHIKRGITLQDMGRESDAVQAFVASVMLDDKHLDLHYKLGLMHTDGRKFNAAVEQMVQEAKDDGPQAADVRSNLYLALQNMGLMDKTAAAWKSLRKTFSQRWPAADAKNNK